MSSNFDNALFFLVSTLFKLGMWVVILRIALQLVRADFYNPVSQLVWRLTQPVVGPVARVVPRYQRWDTASLIVLYAMALLYIQAVFAILSYRVAFLHTLWLAILIGISLTLMLMTFSIFVQAILSWLGPGVNNRAGSVLWSLNEPLLSRLRRIIPPISGIDLSPLAAILLLQVLYYLLPLHPVLR